MQRVYTCDNCDKEVDSPRKLHKIRGIYYCNECRKAKREAHRKETLEKFGDKEKIRELDNKIKNYYRSKEKQKEYQRNYYQRKKEKIEGIPVAKGAKSKKEKITQNSYITLQESQAFFRILVKRGVDPEEAKERIRVLKEYEKEVRKSIQDENKAKQELSKRKDEMLQELWNT